MRNHAAIVAEAGNLLMMVPRAKDGDEWMRLAQAMVDTGAAAMRAAEAKDADQLFQAGADIYSVCSNCHVEVPARDRRGRGQVSRGSRAVLAGLAVALGDRRLRSGRRGPRTDGQERDVRPEHQGQAIGPFLYLGAKHMVTGYDHLLFLVGVIFFLYSVKDVVLYVSLFTLGHSLTLLGGVLGGIQANAHIVDAIIGASVVYKAFENMGGFEKLFGVRPNTRAAVLDLRPVPWLRTRHEAPGVCAQPEWPGHEHRQLQCGRRDRPDAGAGRRARRADVVADAPGLSAPCLRDQYAC